jgi:hypothetical protein
MLDLEPNFTWQQYEHFHVHWETLIRYLALFTIEMLFSFTPQIGYV